MIMTDPFAVAAFARAAINRLENAAVLRWLAKHRPEYLKEFQRITETEDVGAG